MADERDYKAMNERSICEVTIDPNGVWRTLPIYCGYDWELVANIHNDIINQYFKDDRSY